MMNLKEDPAVCVTFFIFFLHETVFMKQTQEESHVYF